MPDPGSTPSEEPAPLPFVQAVRELLIDLRGLLTDRVHLLSLEAHRAGVALGQMAMLVLLAATLFATAWLALWAGLVAAGIALGLAWPWALLMVLAVNVAGAAWALLRARRLVPLLRPSATLRHLTDFDEEGKRDEPAADGQ